MNPYECMDTGWSGRFTKGPRVCYIVRPAKAKTFCCPAKANVTDVLRAGLIMNNMQYFKLKAFLANSNNRIFKYSMWTGRTDLSGQFVGGQTAARRGGAWWLGQAFTWPSVGGWILHPGVCIPAQGWSDSPQRWLIPSRGCWEDRISLACPQKKWPLECWSTPVPSPETGHLVGWEKLGLLVWK